MAELIELVRAAEAAYPARVAARCRDEFLTFAQVGDRSNRAATVLRGLHGLDEGIVALYVGNRIEAIELDLALIKAGLGRVSINTRLAYDEIRYIISNAEARVLVYDPAYADHVDQLLHEIPDLKLLALRWSSGESSYEQALASATPLTAPPKVSPGAPSLLMYTSGTTGRPKGATWTFSTRRASVQNMLLNELDARSAAVMIHVGSLSHGSGSKVVPVYLRGGCNLVLNRFDPPEFFEFAQRYQGTATFVVPTMVKTLVDAALTVAGNPLSSMRHVSYGGAKMPLEVIQAGLDRFGGIFFQVYGSCEAPHPMLYLDRQEHATRDPRVLTSAGRPSIGVDLRLGTPEGLAAPGATGEILLRAPSIMTGYWNDPIATANVVRDGYYHTGDVGQIHDDGAVELVDRIKNVIISGGFNVYPAEIERVLSSHPRVEQVAVYGLPDSQWGEIVAAAIIQKGGGVSEEELTEFAGTSLAGYKKPRAFMFSKSFPLGVTGKVLTAELRKIHQERVTPEDD